MSTVIKIDNLSKSYRLGEVGTGSIAHDLNRFFAKARGKDDPYAKIGSENDRTQKATKGEIVNALSNINLEVKQGDVLGIIGKNGAGKSTLLKILSRITSPTEGSYKIKGRMASLLEVGTGFHPEMTGRENIYMNGTIMGMRKREIDARLDQIVEFAGVAKYIDTPVKRYSSGMTVRLGFSVAAHLDAEILVVDEVLAVGDAEFQKKAIGKMQDVSKGQGRTVLFVSHNMQSVSTLTNKSILLQHGRILYKGLTDDVIRKYLSERSVTSQYSNSKDSGDKPFIKSVRVLTDKPGNVLSFGGQLEFEFEIYSPTKLNSPALSYQIINSKEVPVLHNLNLNDELSFCDEKGITKLRSIIPKCSLYPDSYTVTVHFADKLAKTKLEMLSNICSFEVKVFNEIRDYYWGNGNAVYVENNKWEKIL